jgi:hypothetical protein
MYYELGSAPASAARGRRKIRSIILGKTSGFILA